MSTPINNGGPAFPNFQFTENGKVEICPQGGMTLRDYFAAKAMAGILASANFGSAKDWIGGKAYEAADAMLAARKPDAGV